MEDLTITKARMLTLILSEDQSHKCIRLAKEKGIRGGIVVIGRGTVKSAVLNLLGIKSQKKEVIKFLLKKEQAEEILNYLSEKLKLENPGHGIAYTTSVLDVVGLLERETDKEEDKEEIVATTPQETEGKRVFKKLTVIVDRGMADDVMDIAREAGVRGGTILHGRGAGAEIATKLFGVEIEPEKELVIILTPDDLVDKVVHALSQGLNLDEPGKGVLFIEPILETRGLFETSDKNSKDI